MKKLSILLLALTLTACGSERIVYVDSETKQPITPAELMRHKTPPAKVCVNGSQYYIGTYGLLTPVYVNNGSNKMYVPHCDKNTLSDGINP